MKHGRAERGRISGYEVGARRLSCLRRKLRLQRQLEEFATANVSSTRLRAEPQRALEGEAERHLNLSRASDRLVHDTQAARCWRGIKIRTVNREIVEKQVLRDVIDGDVEARCIGEVEDLEAELEGSPLGQLRELHKREVGPFLPGLAEDVALTGGEIGFVSVARGNRTT